MKRVHDVRTRPVHGEGSHCVFVVLISTLAWALPATTGLPIHHLGAKTRIRVAASDVPVGAEDGTPQFEGRIHDDLTSSQVVILAIHLHAAGKGRRLFRDRKLSREGQGSTRSGSYCSPLHGSFYCRHIVVARFRRFWSKRRCVSDAFPVQGSLGWTLPVSLSLHIRGHPSRNLGGNQGGHPSRNPGGNLGVHLPRNPGGNPARIPPGIRERIWVCIPPGIWEGIWVGISPGIWEGIWDGISPGIRGGIWEGQTFPPPAEPDSGCGTALGTYYQVRGGLSPAPAGLFCSLCLYLNLDLNLFLSGHHRLLHRLCSRRTETVEPGRDSRALSYPKCPGLSCITGKMRSQKMWEASLFLIRATTERKLCPEILPGIGALPFNLVPQKRTCVQLGHRRLLICGCMAEPISRQRP